jgi:hypothetical protein
VNKRPITVTILACVLIAAGAVGLAYHFTEFKAPNAVHSELVWIEFVRLLAIVSGVFMLRGRDWARWLALAWIAFHVAISFFNSVREVAVHAVILALFAYFLLRPEAWRYFRGHKSEGG